MGQQKPIWGVAIQQMNIYLGINKWSRAKNSNMEEKQGRGWLSNICLLVWSQHSTSQYYNGTTRKPIKNCAPLAKVNIWMVPSRNSKKSISSNLQTTSSKECNKITHDHAFSPFILSMWINGQSFKILNPQKKMRKTIRNKGSSFFPSYIVLLFQNIQPSQNHMEHRIGGRMKILIPWNDFW